MKLKLGGALNVLSAGVELYNPKGKGLVTFKGWNGQWWKRIDYGKATWDAALFVAPLKVNLLVWGIEALIPKRGRRRH